MVPVSLSPPPLISRRLPLTRISSGPTTDTLLLQKQIRDSVSYGNDTPLETPKTLRLVEYSPRAWVTAASTTLKQHSFFHNKDACLTGTPFIVSTLRAYLAAVYTIYKMCCSSSDSISQIHGLHHQRRQDFIETLASAYFPPSCTILTWKYFVPKSIVGVASQDCNSL